MYIFGIVKDQNGFAALEVVVDQQLEFIQYGGLRVIDGLLVETDDLNSTLNEIEAIYRSEISAPDTSNDLYQGSGSSLKV